MDYAFFAEDNWAVTRQLKITYGLRWEYEQLPTPFAALVNPAASADCTIIRPTRPTSDRASALPMTSSVQARRSFAVAMVSSSRASSTAPSTTR